MKANIGKTRHALLRSSLQFSDDENEVGKLREFLWTVNHGLFFPPLSFPERLELAQIIKQEALRQLEGDSLVIVIQAICHALDSKCDGSPQQTCEVARFYNLLSSLEFGMGEEDFLEADQYSIQLIKKACKKDPHNPELILNYGRILKDTITRMTDERDLYMEAASEALQYLSFMEANFHDRIPDHAKEDYLVIATNAASLLADSVVPEQIIQTVLGDLQSIGFRAELSKEYWRAVFVQGEIAYKNGDLEKALDLMIEAYQSLKDAPKNRKDEATFMGVIYAILTIAKELEDEEVEKSFMEILETL